MLSQNVLNFFVLRAFHHGSDRYRLSFRKLNYSITNDAAPATHIIFGMFDYFVSKLLQACSWKSRGINAVCTKLLFKKKTTRHTKWKHETHDDAKKRDKYLHLSTALFH
jgi:hypothetical protein